MTEHLDAQYAAQLMTAAVGATGPRSRNDQGAWLKSVIGNAALLHQAITPYNENPTALERALSIQRFRGVLLSVQPREDGRRLEVTFLPLVGKYAGKWINPDAKVPASGPVPMDYAPGYKPSIESWSGPWVQDGQCPERAGLEAQLGRAVVYTAHRERDGEEGVPKGGYRVFDDIVDACDVPTELQAHVTRILRAWNVVAQADQAAERAAQAPARQPEREPDPEPDPEPAAAYTEEDMAPFESPPAQDRSASPEPHADQRASANGAPGEASADQPCPDLPEEIWKTQGLSVGRSDDEPPTPEAVAALKAALKTIQPVARQRPLGPWGARAGVSYISPKTWRDYNLAAGAIAAVWCGREP